MVAIGNHDVHYLGCTRVNPTGWCYYGTDVRQHWNALLGMSFDEWKSNWLQYFPGTAKSISPNREGKPWAAPTRYNINLDSASSVYVIVGLNSGAGSPHWNGDTPVESGDAPLDPGIECEYIRDSLNSGRKMGKTVFIYVTHHFSRSCNDWSVIRQIHIWMYGHKHNYWQSALQNETLVQEKQYYPARLLIGNGGFDEGYIDVVSFAHVTEEVIGAGDRIRINFKVFDTCIKAARCTSEPYLPFDGACWKVCQDIPGGFDNGGGRRKATPSKHGYGFQYEAQ